MLAVVIPAYNEEEALPFCIAKLSKKLESMIDSKAISPRSFMLFVNDGSKDATKEVLKNAIFKNQFLGTQNAGWVCGSPHNSTHKSAQDSKNTQESTHKSAQVSAQKPKIIALNLSTNKGHQNALLCGMEFVADKCECMVSMDCDLQDDINALDEFIDKFKQGYEVLSGVRKDRKSDGLFKKLSALGFYKTMRLLGVNLLSNHADYRLLSSRALKAVLSFKEVNLFLRGIIPLVGFKSGVVYYVREERVAGSTKYPLRKMLSFALDGLTSFSVVPLRLVSALGVVLFGVSLLLGGYVLYVRLFTDYAVYGWASTIIPLCFFGGVQLLSLGIIGEYVGKIYKEVKARPRYFVESVFGE